MSKLTPEETAQVRRELEDYSITEKDERQFIADRILAVKKSIANDGI